MRTLSRIAAVLAVAVTWAAAPAQARRATGCAEGRFVVTEGRELLDPSGPTVLAVNGSTVTVDGACPTRGSAAKRRKGTRLTARWDRCGAVTKLRLQATARDCSAVRGTLRAPKRKAAMVAMPSVCGDGVVDVGAGEQCETGLACAGGAECTSSCRCAGAQPLDCEVGGYPCAWSDVPASVVEASRELADRAGAVLAAGGSTADAAQIVLGDSPAEIQYDQRVVRFRLAGGRPIWLGNLDGPDEPSAAAAAQPVTAPILYRPRSVLDPGENPKSAYVLDPFAWQPLLAGKMGPIVNILSSTRGYEGNVTYLANASANSLTVGLDAFGRFAGHNVVYVSTHGMVMCEDLTTGKAIPCRTAIAAHQVNREQIARVEAAQRGVDYARDADGAWWVLVSADFFRDRYPGGLEDALIVLDGCQSGGSDMEGALEGSNSNFVGWSAPMTAPGSKSVTEPFLAMLAQGRAIHEVYESLGPSGVRDKYGLYGAILTVGSTNVRIRDLPRVIDTSSGNTLTDGSQLEIVGYVDDGKPDSLLLTTELDGIAAADGGATTVEFLIDGKQFVSLPLNEFATPLGDFRWTGDAEFELGFDVTEGQTIDVEVRVQLPEGGHSTFSASPRLTSKQWELGRVWRGTFTKMIDIGIARTMLVVDATFERDPDESGTTNYPTFLLKGGTMTWSLTDQGDNCHWSAPTTTSSFGADDTSWITFDLTKDPIEYRGTARADGPNVPLTVTCSDGSDPPVTSMEAGGAWFTAPADQHYTVEVDSLSGAYYPNSLSSSSWNVIRVE